MSLLSVNWTSNHLLCHATLSISSEVRDTVQYICFTFLQWCKERWINLSKPFHWSPIIFTHVLILKNRWRIQLHAATPSGALLPSWFTFKIFCRPLILEQLVFSIYLFFFLCAEELQRRRQQRQKKLRMEKKREHKISSSDNCSYSSGRFTSE